MRVFYVLLAALAIVFKSESVSAESHENLSKLVSPDQATSREENASRLRYLRGDGIKTTEENDDRSGEERGGREQLFNKLLALDGPTFAAVSTKLDDLGTVDDVISVKKLDEFLDAKKLPAFLNAKKLDELLDMKKIDDMVDPKKLDVVAKWDKKDSKGFANYLFKTFFVDLKKRGADPDIVTMAMRKRGDFSEKFIKNFEDRYALFRILP